MRIVLIELVVQAPSKAHHHSDGREMATAAPAFRSLWGTVMLPRIMAAQEWKPLIPLASNWR
jgi:hypothetical protein